MTKKFLLFMTLLLSCIGYARAQQALPYEYGFENNDLAAAGWVLQGATHANTGISSDAKQNGDYGFRFHYSEQNAYLLSPIFTGGDNGIEVSFWFKNYSSSYTEHFKVGYTTDESVTDASLFTYGEEILGENSWQQYEKSFPAGTKRIAIQYVHTDAFYLYFDDFSFTAAIGSFPKPSDVTVSNVTMESAVLSWTSDADNFDIEVNGTVTENITNPYTLTGLDPATAYEIRVRTNCGGGDVSHWTNPVSFVTEICAPEDQALISYELTDSYGDGWNGNAIKVVHHITGKVIATLTIASGASATGTVALCCGEDYDFIWVKGSYSGETSFVFKDINEEEIISVADGSTLTGNAVFKSYTMDCTVAAAQKPTELAVSGITFNSALLSWTQAGEATQWEICLNGDEENVIAADSNPFTLTNLTPETAYSAKVRSVVGEEKSNWSDAVSFTTLEQFAKPTNVTANNVTTNSADVSWTGTADSYNLRYRTGVAGTVLFADDFENGLSQWTTVRNGEGNVNTDWYALDIVAASDGSITAHGGNNVAWSRSYSSSGYNVDNWLISPQVILGGTLKYWVRDDDQYHEHYDIYVSISGNDISNFTKIYEPGNASGTWTEVTVDLSAYEGLTGYIAFRHTDYDQDYLLIDDVTIIGGGENGEWVEVNNVSSPYTITGLTDGNAYTIEVQAVYADGTSEWVGTRFVTPSSNPLPINVTVDAQHTTATISWQGENDSYKVKYRIPASQEVIIFEDFESGLPEGWTTIDSDGDGNGWVASNTVGNFNCHSGSVCMISASYDGNSGALTPDNWLVTPQIELDGALKIWLRGQDASYAAEHFAVYISTTGSTVDDFTKGGAVLIPEAEVTASYVEYTADLSAYAGQQGYIAIRHFNCTDMFYLNLDDFGIYGADIPAGEWIEIATEDTSVELTGLEMGTEYEYTVIGIKDGEENAGTPIASFTTLTENDKFFITEGNWDVAENWLPAGVPTATCNLTIQANATIPAGVIALANKVTIDGGSITIKDGGELKQNSNELVVTFEKDIKGYTGTRDGYYLIASPIVGTTSSEEVENLLSNDYDYFRFLANQTNEWRSFGMSIFDMQLPTNIEFANNTAGNGYLYASKEDKTLKFTGSIYPVMNAALNITYDGSATYSFNDWRLVGNPFSYSVYMFNVVEGDIDYDSEFYKLNASGDAFEMYPVFVKLAPGEAAFVKVTQTEELYVYSTNPFTEEPSTEGIVGDVPFLPRHGLNAYVDADLIKLADDGDNTDKIVANAQANFMLDGRTLYKDGKWNTLTLPFNVALANSELAGATAKTLSEATVDGTSITLTFGDAVETLTAGTPYIIQWESGEDNIVNPVFDSYGLGATARIITATEGQTVEKADGNVKFIGYYNPVNITAADDDIYYLTADNTLKYTGKDRTLKAFRAYFQFAESEGARTFILDFGEGGTATTIGNLPAEMFGQGDWYTPSGIKVGDSLPAKKGIYINNGKKVVIK